MQPSRSICRKLQTYQPFRHNTWCQRTERSYLNIPYNQPVCWYPIGNERKGWIRLRFPSSFLFTVSVVKRLVVRYITGKVKIITEHYFRLLKKSALKKQTIFFSRSQLRHQFCALWLSEQPIAIGIRGKDIQWRRASGRLSTRQPCSLLIFSHSPLAPFLVFVFYFSPKK